jgi:hypothetical protein
MAIIKKTISSPAVVPAAVIAASNPANLAALVNQVAPVIPDNMQGIQAEGAKVALLLDSVFETGNNVTQQVGKLFTVHIAENTGAAFLQGFNFGIDAATHLKPSTKKQYKSYAAGIIERGVSALPLFVIEKGYMKGMYRSLQQVYKLLNPAAPKSEPQWLIDVKRAHASLEADDVQGAYDILCEILESQMPKVKEEAAPAKAGKAKTKH